MIDHMRHLWECFFQWNFSLFLIIDQWVDHTINKWKIESVDQSIKIFLRNKKCIRNESKWWNDFKVWNEQIELNRFQ